MRLVPVTIREISALISSRAITVGQSTSDPSRDLNPRAPTKVSRPFWSTEVSLQTDFEVSHTYYHLAPPNKFNSSLQLALKFPKSIDLSN